MKNQNQQELTDEVLLENERKWRESQPSKMTVEAHFEPFWKDEGNIDSKLEELKEEISMCKVQTIGWIKKIAMMPENNKILCDAILKHTHIKDLIVLEKQRAQFMRYVYKSKGGKQHKRGILDVESARNYPILTLAESYGRMRRSGKTFTGRCPLHEDRSPSFYVYPDTNSFYCFGCNKGGDTINFVMMKENMGFVDTVKYICDL